MKELIFATNNPHKIAEIQAAIGDSFRLVTLREAGIDIDIPEPHATLEENAQEKSRTIHRLTGKNCFSEDTGLEVTALNGEPGVNSARYAGDDRSDQRNIQKLLQQLGDASNRSARFRTVISLILNNEEYLFEGVCPGAIGTAERGAGGFGYDPVFFPEGSSKTFGQMSMEEKAFFSHRKKATEKLVSFLQKWR